VKGKEELSVISINVVVVGQREEMRVLRQPSSGAYSLLLSETVPVSAHVRLNLKTDLLHAVTAE